MSTRPLPPLSEHSAAPHECPHPVRLEVVSRSPMFSQLSREEIVELEGRIQAPGYQAAEPIYQAGEPGNNLFVVASGAVRLTRPSSQGDHAIINVLGPGESFGTWSAKGRYGENAEAMIETCVVKMPVRTTREIMERHPQVALTALDEVVDRLEESQRAVEQLSVGGASRRIATALLVLANKVGVQRSDRIDLMIPLTRADLASLARTAPETVSRVLNRLRQQGAVDFGRGWTAIVDPSHLATISRQ